MGFGFTKIYEGSTDFYRVDILVGHYKDGKKCWAKFKGIIDTGATQTSINREMAESLGLKPVRETEYITSGTPQKGYVYVTDLKINNTIYVDPFEIGSIENSPLGVEALIGTDILDKCDIAITHANGNTKLTMEWPSIRDIDFRQM